MSDNWDFYPARVDGAPASIFLDMGIARSAPVAGFDKLAYLRLWMNHPRSDGLSSDEEYGTLCAVEDAIEASIGEAGATIFVGRNTSSGCRDLYFYTRDEVAFRASISAALAKFAEYENDVGIRPDREWRVYFDFLYPDDDQKQAMGNRAVIANLGTHGDDGQAPRPIDHLIRAPSREQAATLARVISSDGFKLGPGSPSQGPDSEWWLEFEKVEAPVEVDGTTIKLARLARDHGGEYDGWGCVVVAGRPTRPKVSISSPPPPSARQ